MKNYWIVIFLFISSSLLSNTEKYRLTYQDDPSTSIVIGWRQTNGSNPVVYYDTVDHGTSWQNYAYNHGVDRLTSRKGMDHKFSRITGLIPNTVYYFVIKDTDGTSARYSFKTLSNDPSVPLSIIAGGDSRTNRASRQNANKLVAKLRPDFVYFGGDFTELNFDSEWKNWFDDWQLTISTDGRMYPIVAARGNHEWNNDDIYQMFDTPHPDAYYAITFGGNLLRAYTLNTEMAIPGAQTDWLLSDLQANQHVEWRIAQYHKPIRPHVGSKSEGTNQYSEWAQLFYDFNVQLAIECDAHTVKSTWPVKPSVGANSSEGFERSLIGGTVYVGEGCWGAPLRNADDNKPWTRNSGVFNSFQWLKISQEKIEVKFIKTDNADNVGIVADNNRFAEPTNLDVWNPSNGRVVIIENENYLERPYVEIINPIHNQGFNAAQQTTYQVSATDNGNVLYVDFYINDMKVFTDSSFPYEYQWNIPSDGSYTLTAWAQDDEGYFNVSELVDVYVGTINLELVISQSSDDAEEDIANQSVEITSTDLEMILEDNIWPISDDEQLVGLRFQSVNIPSNATILDAYIQFTADGNDSDPTSLKIYGEKNSNSKTFEETAGNISLRPKTTSFVTWNPLAWNDGDQGSDQQTPSLTSVINEMISQPNWKKGNPLTFIIDGTGKRQAFSYDASDIVAPKLIISFEVSNTNSIIENEEINFNLTAYPNPFYDYIQVNWEENNETGAQLWIYDQQGKMIKEVPNYHKNNRVELDSNLPNGIYLLKFKASAYEKTLKLIK